MGEKRAAAAAEDGGMYMPELAEHERGRILKQKKIAAKATQLGKEPQRRGPGKERKTAEPQNVTVSTRINQFPNNSLKEAARKLYLVLEPGLDLTQRAAHVEASRDYAGRAAHGAWRFWRSRASSAAPKFANSNKIQAKFAPFAAK